MHIMNQQKTRTIYGRRQSRPLKDNQKNLFETLFKAIGIDPLNLPEFPNEVIFEIGFGGGENIAHQAQKYPNALCIGCEPFVNGIASLLQTIEEQKIQNIRIFADDANILLKALPAHVITKGFILFPDPWPKKRHHKRRVVCLENLLQLHKKMARNAELVIATDHPTYLEWIVDITAQATFKNHFQAINTLECPRPSEDDIPVTRYEKKALENRPGAFLIFKAI